MTYEELKVKLQETNTTLVAVSKTKPASAIKELYDKGQHIFGENRVQEMSEKYDALPKDIEWHMIGNLQKNKVKYMAHFVSMIHSVDNEKLLATIDKQAKKQDRTIDILLQVKIAEEESKAGWDQSDLESLILKDGLDTYENVTVRGLMGMATFTDDQEKVISEFRKLKACFDLFATSLNGPSFDTISMGMSGDYELAIAEGSNMVRIGSLLFGAR